MGYKVGDRVKVIDVMEPDKEFGIEIGDVFTIDEIDGGDDLWINLWYKGDEFNHFLIPRQVELYSEPAKPKNPIQEAVHEIEKQIDETKEAIAEHNEKVLEAQKIIDNQEWILHDMHERLEELDKALLALKKI